MNLRPRRRPVPTIPIVSLVDIMVILLIFFVATTTFRKDRTQVKITLPEAKQVGESAPVQEVRKAITVTKDQQLYLEGQPVTAEESKADSASAHRVPRSSPKISPPSA